MKRLLLLCLILLFGCATAYSDTATTNYNLIKPSRGAANWDTKMNANMDTIDGSLFNAVASSIACCSDNSTSVYFVTPFAWIDGGDGTSGNPWTSSTDNTAGIQSAISTGAAAIYMPSGYYAGSSPIEIGNGQRLFGDGEEKTFYSTSSATYGVTMGDNAKGYSVTYAMISGMKITCTGSPTACFQMSAVKHSIVEKLHIVLSGCTASAGFRMDATKVTVGGNYWNTIRDIYIWGGSSGGNTDFWMDGDGSTGTSGRNNSNVLINVNMQGGKYGVTVGPSWGNRFYGMSVEGYCDAGSCVGHANDGGWVWKWDNDSINNNVYGLYMEPGLNYSGNSILCSTSTSEPPSGNQVYAPYWGPGALGTNADHISLRGSNLVHSNKTTYVQPPDTSGSDDGNDTNGTVANVKNAWFHEIRVPGEKGARMKLGIKGIMMQNSDNDTANADMYIYDNSQSNHGVLYAGGATNRSGSTTKDVNPDLSNGNNFSQLNFTADTTITAFENAVGAPTVLYYPAPQGDGLKVNFTNGNDADGNPHEFMMYTDSDASDDNVTIAQVGTTWTVTFAKKSHRYPMQFGCWFTPVTQKRIWMLLNHVRALD